MEEGKNKITAENSTQPFVTEWHVILFTEIWRWNMIWNSLWKTKQNKIGYKMKITHFSFELSVPELTFFKTTGTCSVYAPTNSKIYPSFRPYTYRVLKI